MNKKLIKIRKTVKEIKETSKNVTEFTIRSRIFIEEIRFRLYKNFYYLENIELMTAKLLFVFGFVIIILNSIGKFFELNNAVFLILIVQAMLLFKLRQIKTTQGRRYRKESSKLKKAFSRLRKKDMKKLDIIYLLWYKDKYEMLEDFKDEN